MIDENNIVIPRFLEKLFIYSFAFFMFFNFLDRSISNIFLIFLLLASLIILIKSNYYDETDKKIFFFVTLLVFLFLLLNIHHHQPHHVHSVIHEMNNYSRYLLLLPVYFAAKRIKISIETFFNIIIYSSIIAFLLLIYDTYFLGFNNYDNERYKGTASSIITYGNLIMSLAILLLCNIFRQLPRKICIKSLILFMLMIFTWSATITKGSLIGFLLGFICVLFLYKRYFISFIIASLLFIILFSTNIHVHIKNAFNAYQTIELNIIKDNTKENSSINERIYYIKYSIKKIIENPFIGIGPGEYYKQMRESLKNEKIDLVPRDHAHNEFLDITAKYGIVTLISFLLLHAYLIRVFLKYKNEYTNIGIIFIITQFGFMLTQSQFAHHQAIAFFILILFILLGSTCRISMNLDKG